MYIYIICVLFHISTSSGFNIATNYPIIYENPGNNSNYFGYSVATYRVQQDSPGRLYVGSPNSLQLKDTGTVYQCVLINKCVEEDLLANAAYKKGFIGGNVEIDYKTNILFVTAHHAIVDSMMKGAIFMKDINSNFVTINVPLKNSQPTEIHQQARIARSKVAQAGFSIHVSNESNQVIIGCPGYKQWDGMAVKFKYQNKKKSINFDRPIIPELNNVLEYRLYGYDVSSGYIYNKNKMSYVLTSPRAKDKGKVVIFEFPKASDNYINKLEILDGEVIGGAFGYSVTVGDINNDGLDDLIIGAPFCNMKKFNEGKVYVYLGSVTKHVLRGQTIEGEKINGQLGLNVMYLGDINNDNYGDVAVAAPYEDKHGVVYIFRGERSGLNIKPSQKIVAKDIYSPLTGFGIGMSKAIDLDGNLIGDLAIGAYQSGHVVFLPGRRVVVITAGLEQLTKLESTSETLIIRVKFKFENYSSIDPLPRIINTWSVDEKFSRAEMIDNLPIIQNWTLGEFEQNITFKLKPTTNLIDPLEITLDYEMIDEEKNKSDPTIVSAQKQFQPDNTFCAKCPVLDKERSSGPQKLLINYENGCGNNAVCKSKLSLDIETEGLEKNKHIVGGRKYIHLKAIIKNSQENAFATTLEMSSEEILKFRKIPGNCEKNHTSLAIMCNVKNPLRQNEKTTIYFELYLEDLHVDELIINMKLKTKSENVDGDIEKSLNIKFIQQADVYITGYSEEKTYSFGNETTNLRQIFEIEKTGQTPLESIIVHITVPYAIQLKEKMVFLNNRIMMSNKLLDCANGTENEFSPEIRNRNSRSTKLTNQILTDSEAQNISYNGPNIYSQTYSCNVGGLDSENKKRTVTLELILDHLKLIDHLSNLKILTLTTHAQVSIEKPSNFEQTGDRPDETEVVTTIINNTQVIPIWIFIISAILGLILFCLLVYGLKKAGFFKRTKKEELNKLKARTSGEMEDVDEMLEGDDSVFFENAMETKEDN